VTSFSPPSPSSAPSQGQHGLTSQRSATPPKRHACVDWTSSSEGSRRLSAGEAPPQTSSAHPFCRASAATRGGTSRALCSHRVPTPREGGMSDHQTSDSPQRPAKGAAFRRTPRCVPPTCALNEPKDRSPVSCRRASRPRSTCAPKNTDALQVRESLRLFNPRETPGLTCQASYGGSIERTERMVASPS